MTYFCMDTNTSNKPVQIWNIWSFRFMMELTLLLQQIVAKHTFWNCFILFVLISQMLHKSWVNFSAEIRNFAGTEVSTHEGFYFNKIPLFSPIIDGCVYQRTSSEAFDVGDAAKRWLAMYIRCVVYKGNVVDRTDSSMSFLVRLAQHSVSFHALGRVW